MLQKLSEELRVSSVDVHKISLGEIPSVESMDVAVRQMIKTGVKVPFSRQRQTLHKQHRAQYMSAHRPLACAG